MKNRGKIIIPAGRKPWLHEFRVAEILAAAGYEVKFLPELNRKTADILLNGVEYEIKSPKSFASNSLEHLLKKALKQSPNIIIDISRLRRIRERNILNFLIKQARIRKRIKKIIVITRQGRVVDVSSMI